MRSFLVVLALLLLTGMALAWRGTMPEPVSVELVGGELHVVWRQRSHAEYPVYPSRPVPDHVWKDVYVCGHDEIVLAETIQGTHIPVTENPERFEFPEDSP